MKFRILLTIFSFALLFTGCTRDDLSICVTRTSFKCIFDFNTSQTDLFSKLVNKVDCYIFDESGLLVRHISQANDYFGENFTLSADLKYGLYTVVSYGTVAGNDGVIVGTKQGTLTTQLKAMKVGESRMSDMRLMLNSLNGNSDKDLGVVLHGIAAGIEVTSVPKPPITISFIRNTSVVELSIDGLENIMGEAKADDEISVRIEGGNKAYLHDNTLDMELGRVSHAPFNQHFDGKQLQTKSSVLRLFKEFPMTLKVYSGSNVLWKLNLVEEIMKSPKYNTNEDLDREDTFKLDVKVSATSDFTIIVNGWTTTTASDIVG